MDGEIALKVDQEIASSPVLGGTQIDVAARDGVVTLTGVVASDEQAQSAEKLAWSVEGVEAVEWLRCPGPRARPGAAGGGRRRWKGGTMTGREWPGWSPPPRSGCSR
jgi:hypothetical protein